RRTRHSGRSASAPAGRRQNGASTRRAATPGSCGRSCAVVLPTCGRHGSVGGGGGCDGGRGGGGRGGEGQERGALQLVDRGAGGGARGGDRVVVAHHADPGAVGVLHHVQLHPVDEHRDRRPAVMVVPAAGGRPALYAAALVDLVEGVGGGVVTGVVVGGGARGGAVGRGGTRGDGQGRGGGERTATAEFGHGTSWAGRMRGGTPHAYRVRRSPEKCPRTGWLRSGQFIPCGTELNEDDLAVSGVRRAPERAIPCVRGARRADPWPAVVRPVVSVTPRE